VPAAAVTPAPIAYIKVVAVKKLVVGCLSSAGRRRSESRVFAFHALGARVSKPDSLHGRTTSPEWWSAGRGCIGFDSVECESDSRVSLFSIGIVVVDSIRSTQSIVRGALHRVSRAAGNVYFEQIRVLKAGVSQRLNIAAWNDGIGPRSDFAGLLLLDPR
jgi:hypothetical protein